MIGMKYLNVEKREVIFETKGGAVEMTFYFKMNSMPQGTKILPVALAVLGRMAKTLALVRGMIDGINEGVISPWS